MSSMSHLGHFRMLAQFYTKSAYPANGHRRLLAARTCRLATADFRGFLVLPGQEMRITNGGVHLVDQWIARTKANGAFRVLDGPSGSPSQTRVNALIHHAIASLGLRASARSMI